MMMTWMRKRAVGIGVSRQEHALVISRSHAGLPMRPLVPCILKLTPLTTVIWTPTSVSILISPLKWHLELKAPSLNHQRYLAILSCPSLLKDSPEIKLKMFTWENPHCQHMQVKPPLAPSSPYKNASRITSVSCLKPFNTSPTRYRI